MEHEPRYMYALVIYARRSVCECGHGFTLKKESRITANSPVKRKRALRQIHTTYVTQRKDVQRNTATFAFRLFFRNTTQVSHAMQCKGLKQS